MFTIIISKVFSIIIIIIISAWQITIIIIIISVAAWKDELWAIYWTSPNSYIYIAPAWPYLAYIYDIYIYIYMIYTIYIWYILGHIYPKIYIYIEIWSYDIYHIVLYMIMWELRLTPYWWFSRSVSCNTCRSVNTSNKSSVSDSFGWLSLVRESRKSSLPAWILRCHYPGGNRLYTLDPSCGGGVIFPFANVNFSFFIFE